jgi:hypothetical protein
MESCERTKQGVKKMVFCITFKNGGYVECTDYDIRQAEGEPYPVDDEKLSKDSWVWIYEGNDADGTRLHIGGVPGDSVKEIKEKKYFGG